MGARVGEVILEARGLVHRYPGGDGDTLRGLDLRVTAGRRLALLGANGAGKTTLLLHLNGTLRPREGTVLLDGRPGRHDPAGLAAWRQTVGLVLQEPDDQLFAASVAEDVSFGPLNLGLPEDEVARRVSETLEALRITPLGPRPPHLLSHGQRKRAAIAGILAMRPRVLVLDEPTAGLDHLGKAHLLSTLSRLGEAGATIVFSTHDVDLAHAWADEAALFAEGRVLGQGPATEILADVALLQSARLGTPAVVALRRAGVSVPDGARSVEEWVGNRPNRHPSSGH
ncbi:MAG: ATP-binding cassette domain-containing protein [Alphaproteobacteria bacterium]|nr:ATP-binding cassette domain-containing protein [Alphaproteobacteria bacterium]MBF0130508.1 ATP-binding cassette domain-containing protein [Alphaproteobacteria bacterium]